MSLLLRRRAMMQLAEEGAEGGGPCDGKVVVFRSPSGNYSNARYVSTDYGHSFSRVTSPSFLYSCSNDVDYEGGYWGTITGPKGTWISGSNPKGTAGQWNGSTVYALAFITSLPDQDGYRKMVRLVNSGSNFSRINRIAIAYISGSTVGGGSGRGDVSYSLPSYMSSINLTYGDGALIVGNRQDLTKLIICNEGACAYGAGGVGTASLSIDGGATWVNPKDILIGSQSTLPDGQYRDADWSFDGKKGAIIYNNTLYVTSDGGQSWTARSSDTIGNVQTLAEIKGTEKFKTLYLLHTDANNVHYLKSSKDLGRSWKLVYQYSGTGYRFTVSADGKHFMTWSGTAIIMWADLNEDGTITEFTSATGTKPSSVMHSSVVGSVRISLDNRREGDDPTPEPTQSYAYSMSVNEVKGQILSMISMSWSMVDNKTVRYSFDGTTLNTKTLAYTTNSAGESNIYTTKGYAQFFDMYENNDPSYYLTFTGSLLGSPFKVTGTSYSNIENQAATTIANRMLSVSGGPIYFRYTT